MISSEKIEIHGYDYNEEESLVELEVTLLERGNKKAFLLFPKDDILRGLGIEMAVDDKTFKESFCDNIVGKTITMDIEKVHVTGNDIERCISEAREELNIIQTQNKIKGE